MKAIKGSHIAREILILTGVMTAAVFAYNTWSYCCGRCSAGTFMTLGPVGMGLLGANLLAFAVLVWLRLRRRGSPPHDLCSCGTILAADWHFCPDCGHPTRSSLA